MNKSKLSNTMTQNTLETSLIVFVEQELPSKIDDYDGINNEFKTMVPHDGRLIL